MAAEKIKRNLDKINAQATLSEWLVDFGCGRIFVGLKDLSSERWMSMSQAICSQEGVIQLEKFPESFGLENDVFAGIQKPEWQLTRIIKQALDPAGLFVSHQLPRLVSQTG
jgi:hypothetical protein